MRISVKVKIKSSPEKVEKIDESNYIVRINTPPVGGRANERVIKLLSDYFTLSKSSICIVSGLKSKNKLIEIFR